MLISLLVNIILHPNHYNWCHLEIRQFLERQKISNEKIFFENAVDELSESVLVVERSSVSEARYSTTLIVET